MLLTYLNASTPSTGWSRNHPVKGILKIDVKSLKCLVISQLTIDEMTAKYASNTNIDRLITLFDCLVV